MTFRGDKKQLDYRVGSGARFLTTAEEALRPHNEGVTPPSNSPASHRPNTTSLKPFSPYPIRLHSIPLVLYRLCPHSSCFGGALRALRTPMVRSCERGTVLWVFRGLRAGNPRAGLKIVSPPCVPFRPSLICFSPLCPLS